MNLYIKKIVGIAFCSLLLGLSLQAQMLETPTPAPPQSKPVWISGGTLHTATGKVIEDAMLKFDDGKITHIGKNRAEMAGKDIRVIDATGKHIYPGLIAANTNIGLVEIAAIRASRDAHEVGTLNPSVRSIISYNTDSRVTPTLRSNGLLIAQIVPQGGHVSGSSSVVQLDAWNWEDAALSLDEGMHMEWPKKFKFKGWWAQPGGIELNEDYQDQIEEATHFFAEAKAYCQNNAADTKNLKLTGMCPLFEDNAKLYIHANNISEIIDAVNFAKKEEVRLVIVGAKDAWLATNILKENDVEVIIVKTHDLPVREDDDYDMVYKLPKILQDAGITYALTVGYDWDSFWNQRNLAFNAGSAATFGLNKEAALQSITLNPAKILGIDDMYGTLEEGKSATLIISEGDIMEMSESTVTDAFIDGRTIDLNNKQKALYRKFAQKYGIVPNE